MRDRGSTEFTQTPQIIIRGEAARRHRLLTAAQA
jgi:hypothetical protein